MIDTDQLKNKYAPEGSLMREYQRKMLDEVVFLDRVCKDNHLTYFLTGGSTLGAVRHQGFIPWDDDMDIALPQKDYDKLVEILRKMDSEKYVLHDHQSDVDYVLCFAKFREKEGNLLGSFPDRGKLYKYKGVGVDVFSIGKNSFIRSFVCAKLRVALLHYTYLIRNDKLRYFVTRIQWAAFQCLAPLTWPLNVFRKKGEMHYGIGQGPAKHYMWEQEVFPLKEAAFEGVSLPIPHDSDAFLTHIYGNWRQVPSEDEIARTVHNIELISNRQKNYG